MDVILSYFSTEFEWLTMPSAWAGLFALVVMEVVLGVDNLVFIAILSNSVEPTKRDHARVVGLLLAVLVRLVLLSVMSKLVTLTNPLFSLGSITFSWRDLIFIVGGIFLLYKSTSELHERLEGVPVVVRNQQTYAKFWTVVLEIMVLDAVFSLDSVITAVGMVDHVTIMMLAVIIAMMLMLLASKPLSSFVNAHPTVVMLCLSFLLMIGFSLVIEGFGFHVPKGYIYAAIGFSVLIEVLNQVAMRNYRKVQAGRPWRERTAETILRLMGEKNKLTSVSRDAEKVPELKPQALSIAGEESNMISGVLSLGERSLRSLMTPRSEICWINLNESAVDVRAVVEEGPHSHYPVCRESLDDVAGVARGADILEHLRVHGSMENFKDLRAAQMAPESMDAIRLLPLMRRSAGHMVLAVDEFGSISGLVTAVDVFEIIAGEFLEEDERPDIIPLDDGRFLAEGNADLHLLEQMLDIEGLLMPDSDYGTVAGLLLDNLGHLPVQGEELDYNGLRFTVRRVSDRRIEEVVVSRLEEEPESEAAE